jgi:hypothetical protein
MDFREGEAPAEPGATAGRRPLEASFWASGGRRAKARPRLGGSLALPFFAPDGVYRG